MITRNEPLIASLAALADETRRGSHNHPEHKTRLGPPLIRMRVFFLDRTAVRAGSFLSVAASEERRRLTVRGLTAWPASGGPQLD
jgi:hypothetical protein